MSSLGDLLDKPRTRRRSPPLTPDTLTPDTASASLPEPKQPAKRRSAKPKPAAIALGADDAPIAPPAASSPRKPRTKRTTPAAGLAAFGVAAVAVKAMPPSAAAFTPPPPVDELTPEALACWRVSEGDLFGFTRRDAPPDVVHSGAPVASSAPIDLPSPGELTDDARSCWRGLAPDEPVADIVLHHVEPALPPEPVIQADAPQELPALSSEPLPHGEPPGEDGSTEDAAAGWPALEGEPDEEHGDHDDDMVLPDHALALSSPQPVIALQDPEDTPRPAEAITAPVPDVAHEPDEPEPIRSDDQALPDSTASGERDDIAADVADEPVEPTTGIVEPEAVSVEQVDPPLPESGPEPEPVVVAWRAPPAAPATPQAAVTATRPSYESPAAELTRWQAELQPATHYIEEPAAPPVDVDATHRWTASEPRRSASVSWPAQTEAETPWTDTDTEESPGWWTGRKMLLATACVAALLLLVGSQIPGLFTDMPSRTARPAPAATVAATQPVKVVTVLTDAPPDPAPQAAATAPVPPAPVQAAAPPPVAAAVPPPVEATAPVSASAPPVPVATAEPAPPPPAALPLLPTEPPPAPSIAMPAPAPPVLAAAIPPKPVPVQAPAPSPIPAPAPDDRPDPAKAARLLTIGKALLSIGQTNDAQEMLKASARLGSAEAAKMAEAYRKDFAKP